MEMSLLQIAWRRFCKGVVAVFYRHCEVSGLENLPSQGPVLLCANHANALADAVIIQAVLERTVHPIARSGLFKNPLLNIVLSVIQAVPVYRRQDNTGEMQGNQQSFARCVDFLEKGECLLIFPEGQSHSDPKLRSMKTGAARMVLSAKERGVDVCVIPMGLNFSNKGKFRSRVLVNIKAPLQPAVELQNTPSTVKQLTAEIQDALEGVTINAESTEEIDFMQRVERFFAMRHGKYRHRDMALRFRAQKKIGEAQQRLRENNPVEIAHIKRQLMQFERLCSRWGIRDYHLSVKYRPTVVAQFLVRCAIVLVFILPLAVWGTVNSFVPFWLTRHSAKRISKGTDQYDTAKMVLGLFFFWLFWLGQTTALYLNFDLNVAVFYAISLPPSAAAALFFRKEKERIWDNLRVFFLFVRKKKLKTYLQNKRHQIEKDLAHLVRIAKQKYSTS